MAGDVTTLATEAPLLRDDYYHAPRPGTSRTKKRTSPSRKERPMAAKKANAPMIKKSHRGLLHKNLGVPAGEKIGKAKLEAAKQSSDPAIRKRANFALNFNDAGTHGVVTGVHAHASGKHVMVDVAHGRKKAGPDGKVSGYDDRPRSSVMIPKAQASQFPVGQRVGVGAIPLSGANTDEMPDGDESPAPAPAKKSFPPKKGASKKKAAPKKSATPSPIAQAMGAKY